MLRLVVVDNLRRLAVQILCARDDRREAKTWADRCLCGPAAPPPGRPDWSDSFLVQLMDWMHEQGAAAGRGVEWLEGHLSGCGLTVDHVLRGKRQRQAANQVSIGNCVTSLRLLSALDWHAFFERTSLVEAVLREDPAGVYVGQDFATRDRYRQAVERLSRGSPTDEVEVARTTVALADRRFPSNGDGAGAARNHVGYYLIGEGRAELERLVRYRPKPRDRVLRFVLKHPRLVYFGGVAAVTVLVLAVLVAAVGPWAGGATAALAVLAVLLALPPASDVAVSLVNYWVGGFLPPRVLPKMLFKEGVPANCAAFVVMPTLLMRPRHGRPAGAFRGPLPLQSRSAPVLRPADRLRRRPDEHLPADEAYLRAALDGIREPQRPLPLPRRRETASSCSTAAGCGTRRKAAGWAGNASAASCSEFNRLLRGDTATPAIPRVSSELESVPAYPLCHHAGHRHAAAARAPAGWSAPWPIPSTSRASTRRQGGSSRATASCSRASALRCRRPHARSSPASSPARPASTRTPPPFPTSIRTCSARQLHRQGHLRRGCLRGGRRPHLPRKPHPQPRPDRGQLRPLRPGHRHRVARRFPASLPRLRPARTPLGARRLADPAVAVPARPRDGRGTRSNPLPAVERWKIFDNLRRTLVPPALLLLLVLGWTVLPGSPWLWTAAALVVLAWPLLHATGQHSVPDAPASWRGSVKASPVPAGLGNTAAQVLLRPSFLVDQARLLVDAIGRTLVRLFVTRRHLLEWETAAATEQRLGSGLAAFLRTMWSSAVRWRVALAASWSSCAPAALPAAAPFLSAWLVVAAGGLLGEPAAPAREETLTARRDTAVAAAGPQDLGLLRDLRRRGGPLAAARQLPGRSAKAGGPSHLADQHGPAAALDAGRPRFRLPRASPALIERLEKTFDTLDRLERYARAISTTGTTRRRCKSLPPIYVSTVDSGNLLGCLLTLKQGLLREGVRADTEFG